MGRVLLAMGLLALAAGCGANPSSDAPSDSGPSCVAIGSDSFCGARQPCCGGGYCDNITGYCRDPNECGVSGQGCDGAGSPPCCEGLLCNQGECAAPRGGATTGSGSTGGTTASTTTGCQPVSASCSVNSDCCSGFCADGNHLCGNPPLSSGTTSGGTTSGGTTSGGTCFGSGVGCSSGTECCSGVCNGVCS